MTMQLGSQRYSSSTAFRTYLKFALGWVQVVCLIYALLLVVLERASWWRGFFNAWIIAQVATFTCFWGSYAWIHLVAPLKKEKFFVKSWVHNALTDLAFLPFGIYFGVEVRNLIWQMIGLESKALDWEHLLIGLILGSICIGIGFAISNYMEKKERANALLLDVKKLEIENLTSKLKTLSLQMNPHFLFNLLNNLAESIHTQPEIAEKITITLADLLRKVLEATKKETHPLSNELSLCHSYIELEKLRYDFKLVKNIESSISSKVIEFPVMLIQPLLENAIRYGRGDSIHWDIYQEGAYLIVKVRNRINKDEQIKSGTQTALENIKSRLALLYPNQGASLSLDNREVDFVLVTLKIPIGSFSR